MTSSTLNAPISSGGQAKEEDVFTAQSPREVYQRLGRLMRHQATAITRTASSSRVICEQTIDLPPDLLVTFEEVLAEYEWETRFSTPSRQQQALRLLLAEGRRQYEDGETEEITGDTLA